MHVAVCCSKDCAVVLYIESPEIGFFLKSANEKNTIVFELEKQRKKPKDYKQINGSSEKVNEQSNKKNYLGQMNDT